MKRSVKIYAHMQKKLEKLTIFSPKVSLKGTVSRDFRSWVFSIKQLLIVPLEVFYDDFKFCRIFA